GRTKNLQVRHPPSGVCTNPKPLNHADIRDAKGERQRTDGYQFRVTSSTRYSPRFHRGRMVHAMKTESETYFEEFCRRNGFTLLTVQVTTTKTPDYTLTVGGQQVVVEVKEIQPTDDELESESLATDRDF